MVPKVTSLVARGQNDWSPTTGTFPLPWSNPDQTSFCVSVLSGNSLSQSPDLLPDTSQACRDLWYPMTQRFTTFVDVQGVRGAVETLLLRHSPPAFTPSTLCLLVPLVFPSRSGEGPRSKDTVVRVTSRTFFFVLLAVTRGPESTSQSGRCRPRPVSGLYGPGRDPFRETHETGYSLGP